MRQFLIAPLALLGAPSWAYADKVYTVYGFGNESCGAYVAARSDVNDHGVFYGTWLDGYITAINLRSDEINNILEGTDFEGAPRYFGCGPPYLAVPEIFEHGLKWLTAGMNGTGKGMIE
jgi:hypothetical protein